jgi:hypothetical protein
MIFRRTPRDWAVVQDLRPFGIRVEETGLTHARAVRHAAGSRYLTAMQESEVDRINARCADPAGFTAELRAWEEGRH